MSIPKLTALIGEHAFGGNQNECSSLVKNVKVKEDEEAYVVFLVIDLSKEQIYFRLDNKLTHDSVYDYNYFGNNPGAASQYYIVRETVSLKYLLSSTFSDLYQLLEKNNMKNGQLAQLIKSMQQKDLVRLAKRKGEGSLNIEKFSLVKSGKIGSIKLDGNNIEIEERRYNPEAFIRLFIKDDNKKNKFVLVVPKVILEGDEEIILSTHEEYLELVKKENKLGASEAKKGKDKVCYICKRTSPDVSSSFTKKFGRTGINKIFTTTTKNTAPFLQKYNYDNVYSICSKCYQDLLLGEKAIQRHFRSKIAGEDAFIVPQGILQDFDYEFLGILKKDVDLAFKSNTAQEWIETVDMEKDQSGVEQYAINFIIYRTDGNSVTILETIEDVPTLRLSRIMEILNEITKRLRPHTVNVSLGSIYRLIPVKVDKTGDQLDIGRVLSLYKAILSGERINNQILFDYAVEGMEKGLKHLSKSMVDNYYNMGLTGYVNGFEDFLIKRLVFGYIVLIKACQELGILDCEVFRSVKKEDEVLDSFHTPSKEVNLSIMEIEEFLHRQGFNNEAKALFYLGVLVNRVAMAQMRKEHRKKPILRKIQFQGMSEKELYALYQDVIEKLRQYNKMTLFSEGIMNRFHYYYGSLDKTWPLNDRANVFYIMAGYAYMVGSKAPDSTKEEEEAQREYIEE